MSLVEDIGPPDPMVAVLAHALLSSMAVISGALDSLLDFGEDLPVDDRLDLVRMAASQADYVSEVLKDFARGLGAEVIAALDNISDRRPPDGEHEVSDSVGFRRSIVDTTPR